jgi:hypothetical protein
MQIPQILDVKMPPLEQCQLSRSGNRLVIRCNQDPARLEARIIRDHALSFLFNGHLIRDQVVSSWRLPYDRDEIMRYGHRLNTDAPPSAAEAEFPREPWPDQVTIRVKSPVPVMTPPAPTLVGGPSGQLPPPGAWGRAQLGPAVVPDP